MGCVYFLELELSVSPGVIYVVATPIGNLSDMSERAITTLKNVDLILAEDTRHSLPLLRHFQIQTKCQAFHEHNEKIIAERLCKKVLSGESVAIISDAGVPLISDPGFPLVKLAHEYQIKVEPIPGACAAITALSASGLATDRFSFEGFLPAKSVARKKALNALVDETRTMIFYESPRRVIDTLTDMVAVMGEAREAVLGRELTKLFETIRKAPLSELLAFVSGDENQRKGEIVLMLAGNQPAATEDGVTLKIDQVLQTLMADLPLKQAVSLASKLTGEKKNLVYQRALSMKEND